MLKQLFGTIASILMAGGAVNAQGVQLSGTGTVTAKPDMAYVTLHVASENKTAATATLDNSKAMSQLCATVESFNIEKKDIRTTGFHVFPRYEHTETQRLIGYIVNNGLHITVRDLSVLGKLLDSAVVNGATTLAIFNGMLLINRRFLQMLVDWLSMMLIRERPSMLSKVISNLAIFKA